jgi:hypothetical protein
VRNPYGGRKCSWFYFYFLVSQLTTILTITLKSIKHYNRTQALWILSLINCLWSELVLIPCPRLVFFEFGIFLKHEPKSPTPRPSPEAQPRGPSPDPRAPRTCEGRDPEAGADSSEVGGLPDLGADMVRKFWHLLFFIYLYLFIIYLLFIRIILILLVLSLYLFSN